MSFRPSPHTHHPNHAMEQVHSSPEASTDEESESKLKLGLTLVQDSDVTIQLLQEQVKRAKARCKHAEQKYKASEKRGTKWEKLYRELKAAQNTNQEEDDGVESESEQESEVDERKPAALARSKRKSDTNSEGSSRKRAGGEQNNKRDTSSEESGESVSDEESMDPFTSFKKRTQEWISAIGLKEQYGARYEGLDGIDADTYIGPPSFEHIFHLADFLFPVEEGEDTYHWRLWKRESRRGYSVRDELRRIKQETPDDPMVCWHQSAKPWIPPNADALAAMVRLIVNW